MEVKDIGNTKFKTAIKCGLVLWAVHPFIFSLLLSGHLIFSWYGIPILDSLFILLVRYFPWVAVFEGVGFALFCLALRGLPISLNVKSRVFLLYLSEIAVLATFVWKLFHVDWCAWSLTGLNIWHFSPLPAVFDLLNGFFFIVFFIQVFDAFQPRERAYKVIVVFLSFAVGFLHGGVNLEHCVVLDPFFRRWQVIWPHELFDMVPPFLFLAAIAGFTLLGCVALAVRRKRLETKKFFSRSVNEKMGKRKPAASKGGER